MNSIARFFRACSIAALLIFASGHARAQEESTLSGTWYGKWTEPEGFIYLAELHLKVALNGAIEGDIKWTLNKSPRIEEKGKLGLTGVEFIRGEFDPKSRLLTFEGYRKEDPNAMIGLDKYRLVFADNGKVIGGITWDQGPWLGLFSLTREISASR